MITKRLWETPTAGKFGDWRKLDVRFFWQFAG